MNGNAYIFILASRSKDPEASILAQSNEKCVRLFADSIPAYMSDAPRILLAPNAGQGSSAQGASGSFMQRPPENNFGRPFSSLV